MARRGVFGLAAIGTVGALALAACSSGSTTTPPPSGFNKASTSVVNPSTQKGGTIVFDNSSGPDSTDAGNTYYAFNLNFTRLYATPLTTYQSCPGKCGANVVPALATALGTATDGNKTWTFHLKPNVKFEDGTTVTSQDVKYAVERTFDRSVLPNGPSYFATLLGGNAAHYPGPFKNRSKNLMGLTAITTPNPTTVVFQLNQPFADFNYVVAFPQTAPVPPSKDTGANYQKHPLSTGPYKFASYQLNKQYTLVPNPQWNPSWNPQVKQLASKVIVNLNVNANDIDNRLLAGDISVDQAGSGVQAAARAKILSNPTLKANSDDPVTGFMWFYYINSKVPPLNNIHCRMAVEYAANKVNYQTAYGGPYAGGQIASTVAPPNVVGQKHFDLYEATTKPQGDPAKAKEQLKECGHPNGFNIGVSYRSDRPKEVAAATALQQALSQVGIKTTLHGYPTGTYYANFAGVPKYNHQHDIGIAFGGWAPDWPDGYGFFYYITDSATIAPTGNYNVEELNDPLVNSDLSKMAATNDATTRNSYTSQIDMQVMKQAAILPEVYAKSLIYRSPNLTNVFVQPYYGMYNYSTLGLK
jgi:peptide/nickel transport system substrate-binding protein